MAKVFLEIEIDAQGNVRAIEGAEKALAGVEKQGDQAARSLEKVRQAQDRLATGAIVAGTAVLAGSYVAVQAASDLEEAESKVGVVFGENAKEIQAWAQDSASAMGMSKRAALEAAGTYGNLFTASGMAEDAAAKMSKETVELAADLASFNNLDPEETLIKLRSGLTGEIEPLKQLGAQFTQAEMKAKALEMGLGGVGRELTEGEKIQARYALIMEKTTKAQGDFARTSEGIANSQRIMKAEIEDATASIGQALQPAMKALLDVAKPVAGWIGNIAQTPLGKWAIVAGAGMGALAVGVGVAYKGIVAFQGIMQLVNTVLAFYQGRVVSNTAALTAETGALGANTAAQNINAAAAARGGAARAVRGGAGAVGGAAGAVGKGVAVVGGAVAAGSIGYAAGGAALETESVGKQAAYGAGGVAGGAATGAVVGSIVPGVGTAVGAVGGAAIAGGAGLYRMGRDMRRERREQQALTKDVEVYQDKLSKMSSAERKAFVAAQGAGRQQMVVEHRHTASSRLASELAQSPEIRQQANELIERALRP